MGFRDPPTGKIKAYVLQLNANSPIPHVLKLFLTNTSYTFIGVNVGQDIRHLENDYSFSRDESGHPSVLDLQMMAHRRGLLPTAKCQLVKLVALVLDGQTMNKDDAIRCSKWSRTILTKDQLLYAGIDVIKPLEVYEKLLALPDLQSRLVDLPLEDLVDMEVDVVPRSGRKAELNTRGAIGKVTDKTELSYPGGLFEKTHRKIDPTKQVIVKVHTVVGQSLKIPDHRLRGKRALASLGDFGSDEFLVALPRSMVRAHVQECVAFGAPADFAAAARASGAVQNGIRCITRPAPSSATTKQKDVLVVETIILDDDDEEDDDYGDENNFVADALQNFVEDEGGDGGDADPIAKARNGAAGALLNEAMMRADNFEKDPDTFIHHMLCKQLPLPNHRIRRRWKAVLGDIFHLMDRIKISPQHDCRKAFLRALMDAIFVFNPESFADVCEKLRSGGWTELDIEDKLFYNPKFFLKRVERFVPPPDILYWRVRSVFVVFGDRKDSKTNVPLFRNKKMWDQAQNILNDIEMGYYSDPPGVDFYHYIVKDDGTVKTDKYGIKLLRCTRGTNSVENTHRQYSTTFRFRAGCELADCLLGERRHRQNEKIARALFDGHPDIGHFDTFLIDKLQNLLERNHKKSLYDSWVNASDFKQTEESFSMVALHNKELADALANIEIDEDIQKGYSKDLRFLCERMGVKVPFLPVHGEDECKLFWSLLHNATSSFNPQMAALKWMEHINGKTIFPKLPAHLTNYLRKHERNRRIRRAASDMKAQTAQLRGVNKELNPFIDSDSDRPSNLADEDAGTPDDPPLNFDHDDASTPAAESATPMPSPRKRVPFHPQRAVAPPRQPVYAPGAYLLPTLPFFVGTTNVRDVQVGTGTTKRRKDRTCLSCMYPWYLCPGASQGRNACIHQK